MIKRVRCDMECILIKTDFWLQGKRNHFLPQVKSLVILRKMSSFRQTRQHIFFFFWLSRVSELTHQWGIWRRIKERQYMDTEITTPAMKLWSSFWLSLVGTKTVLSVFVSSKSLYDICRRIVECPTEKTDGEKMDQIWSQLKIFRKMTSERT